MVPRFEKEVKLDSSRVPKQCKNWNQTDLNKNKKNNSSSSPWFRVRKMYWDKFGDDFGCDRFGGCIEGKFGVDFGQGQFLGMFGKQIWG